MRRFSLAFDPLATLLTLAIGAAGGLAAKAAGLPLALLLGSLTAVGCSAAFRLRLFNRAIAVPQSLRTLFVPVIGLGIGGSFTPEVLAQMPGWWSSLLALGLYIPMAHYIGYRIYRRLGPLDAPTAFFGAVPGGLIESVTLGQEAGADERMLVLLQFLRLILTIVAVPLIFSWLTGHTVGSSAGVSTGGHSPLGAPDVLVLALCGVLGVLIGTRLRMPAAVMTGPLTLSALAHLAGLTEAVPPGWAVQVTQVVIGSVLGARFAGLTRGALPMALRLAVVNVSAMMLLAFGFAFALAGVVGQPAMAVFLAFAPGGLAEMSLIALSLQMSVVYVTAHHVARIIFSVLVARAFSGRIG
ncbi:MAG: Ammonia monooxygenase [Cereibacter sp.]|jgi:hypothetical protein|nr:Ammonia monooxygenase [Cereibacter sp.]